VALQLDGISISTSDGGGGAFSLSGSVKCMSKILAALQSLSSLIYNG
jgi:hypothetical protein